MLRDLYEVSGGSSRLIPMEGMRGFAVFMVFFVHLHALFGIWLRSDPGLFDVSAALGNLGNVGVDLFFVLSGYLIYGALLRKSTPYLKFVKRRVERIYPTFLAVFGAYIALSLIFPDRSKIHGHLIPVTLYVLENLLLLPGIFSIQPIITVAWSLSYEFFFYLSIPLIVQIGHIRSWRRPARVIFFVVLFAGYLLYAFWAPRSHARMLMFVAGIFLFELLDCGRVDAKLTRRGELIALSAFIFSLVFVFIYDTHPAWLYFLPRLQGGSNILPGVPTIQGPYKVIVLGAGLLLLTLYSLCFRGFLARFFSWLPLRYLGNMSYSYYLVHGLTLQGVMLVASFVLPAEMRNVWTYFLIVPFAFGATLVSATLLFVLVEKPISLERRRVAKVSPIADVATN